MLTFEEFFIKKKIDLTILEKDDKTLYEEFKHHYGVMGEKSFDHTKKYWFNRLRKEYPLENQIEVPTSTESKESAETNRADISKHKASGFKPRFKAQFVKESNVQSEKTEGELPAEKTNNPQTTAHKPAGFKPRLKTKIISEATAPTEPKPVSKPADFKPRFKAQTVKTNDEDPKKNEEGEQSNVEKTSNPQITINKPTGFKPRVKAKILPETELPAQPKPVSKPAGFKPRFKAQTVKKDPSSDEDQGRSEKED